MRDEVDTTVPGVRCGRRSSTGTASWPTTSPPIAMPRRGREADGRRGHRRDRVGRVGAHGVLTTGGHRVIRLVRVLRAPRTSGSGGPRPPHPTCCPASTPWSIWRCLDRGTVHRGAQGRDPRQPHRADAPAGAGGGRQRRRPAGVRERLGRRHLRYDRGDALLCEESVRGDGFLADVVADWEAATRPAPTQACAWSPCAPG